MRMKKEKYNYYVHRKAGIVYRQVKTNNSEPYEHDDRDYLWGWNTDQDQSRGWNILWGPQRYMKMNYIRPNDRTYVKEQIKENFKRITKEEAFIEIL